MTPDILCIGECMLEFAPDPADGEGRYREGFAGDTFNTAVYLARLQARPVHYMTAVGEDTLSNRLIERCRAEGLATDWVRRLADRTIGLYLVETDGDGERRFHYWRGESAARAMLRDIDRADLVARLRGFGTLYFSGITLAILGRAGRRLLLDALAELRGEGGARTILFDPNYRPALWPEADAARDAYRAAAAVSDIVLGAWDDDVALFAAPHPEAAAARWREWGAAAVVLRTGASGSLVVGPDGAAARVEAPAPPARACDTTGGGDAFNAAFLAAHLEGDGLTRAAAFGHRIAAHVVTCPGAIVARDQWHRLFPAATATGKVDAP